MGGTLKKGERVKHATKTEWGIGEVLADASPSGVEVFFEDVGAKTFDPVQAKFVRLSGSDAESDYLTALVRNYRYRVARPAPLGKKATPSFVPLSKAVENFLSYFPAGFGDPAYKDGKSGERAYKAQAHLLMVDLLSEEAIFEMLGSGQCLEISDRAMRVVNKTNLISPYEKIWLSQALKVDANQRPFADALANLLYGPGEMQLRFERYAEVLASVGAAKWPIATYFQFIRFPNEHIFLKPLVTQEAANALGQEISYRPELNWLTYSQVLALAERIRRELEKDGRIELKPADMIDVQSFIWVTAPGYSQ